MLIQIWDLSHCRFFFLFFLAKSLENVHTLSPNHLTSRPPQWAANQCLVKTWKENQKRKQSGMGASALHVGELLSVGGGLCSPWMPFCELVYVFFFTGLVEPWCAQPAGWTLSFLMFFLHYSQLCLGFGLSWDLKVSDVSNVASLLCIDFFFFNRHILVFSPWVR